MAGALKVKRVYYYAVINYKDNYGKHKHKWFNTGLKERVNKKEAQRILDKKLNTFQPDLFEAQPELLVKNDILWTMLKIMLRIYKKNCHLLFMLVICTALTL